MDAALEFAFEASDVFAAEVDVVIVAEGKHGAVQCGSGRSDGYDRDDGDQEEQVEDEIPQAERDELPYGAIGIVVHWTSVFVDIPSILAVERAELTS